MGALDRKERVNCVWTKVVPFLFQASLLIPNDLFMFFCDLFISCVADSMHRKKKAPSFRQCFVPGAFHGQALTDVLLTSDMLVEPHLLKKHCPLKTHNHVFFMLPFVRHYVHLFFFLFFFFRPIFGTAASAVKYKNSFSPEFYFTQNGTVQKKNILSRNWCLPHEL